MRRWLVSGAAAFLATSGAAAERLEQTIKVDGVPSVVVLSTGEERATLSQGPAGSDDRTERHLYSPRDILPLLADERLAAFWPLIDRWAGEDLQLLVSRRLAQRRAGWRQGYAAPPATTGESLMRARARALAQYAQALIDAGREDEAVSLLDRELATMRVRSARERQEWALLSNMAAGAVVAMGRSDEGIARFRALSDQLGTDPVALNARISMAATLADGGRHSEALVMEEEVRRAFLAAAGDRQMPGSMLFFDMIRACALKGLGRDEEGDRLMAAVAAAAQPTERHVIPPEGVMIAARGHSCRRDPAGLAATWMRDIASGTLAPRSMLLAQPALRVRHLDGATFAAARAEWPQPATMRVLPARYETWLRE